MLQVCGANLFYISYAIEMKLHICMKCIDQDTVFVPSNPGVTELCALELCVEAMAGVLLVCVTNLWFYI